MHEAARQFVVGVIREQQLVFVDVVELGSYNVNGSARDLFLHATSYVGVDVRDGPDVDVVMDAADFQPAAPVDVVVCMETLEHANNWELICENAWWMLKRGGIFIVTAATPERIPHGCDGGDVGATESYGAITPDALTEVLRDLDFVPAEVLHNVAAGDVYAWAKRP